MKIFQAVFLFCVSLIFVSNSIAQDITINPNQADGLNPCRGSFYEYSLNPDDLPNPSRITSITWTLQNTRTGESTIIAYSQTAYSATSTWSQPGNDGYTLTAAIMARRNDTVDEDGNPVFGGGYLTTYSNTLYIQPKRSYPVVHGVYGPSVNICKNSMSGIIDLDNPGLVTKSAAGGYWTTASEGILSGARFLNVDNLQAGSSYTLSYWEEGRSESEYCGQVTNRLTIYALSGAIIPVPDQTIDYGVAANNGIALDNGYIWSGEGVSHTNGAYLFRAGRSGTFSLDFYSPYNCGYGEKIVHVVSSTNIRFDGNGLEPCIGEEYRYYLDTDELQSFKNGREIKKLTWKVSFPDGRPERIIQENNYMTDVRIRWQTGDIGGVLGVEVTLKKSETGSQYLPEQTFLLDSKTITLKPNVPSAGFNNVYPIPMLVCSSSPILDLNNDDRIKVAVSGQNIEIPRNSVYWTSPQTGVVQNGRYLNPSLLEPGKEYTLYVWENGKSATDYCASDINKLTIKIVDYASIPDDMLVIAPSITHIPLNGPYQWSGTGVYGNLNTGYYFDPNGLLEGRYVLTFEGTPSCQRGRKIIVIKAVEAMPVVERSSNEVATVLKEGVINPEDVGALSVENGEVSIQKTFYDALGRPTQSIAKQASPEKKDIVSFNVYDPLGRMPIRYMPFTEGVDGEWKPDVLVKQKEFYKNTAGIAHSNFAYGKVDLENSVFGRVVSVYAPGTNWEGSGNGSGIKQKTNGADQVRMLKAGFGTAPPTISPEESAGIGSEMVLTAYDAAQNDVKAKVGIEILQGFEIGEGEELALTIMEIPDGLVKDMLNRNQFYPAGELVATEVTDAEGRISRKYTDKSGQTVMSEAQSDESGTAFLQTYQVYDDFGRLRYIFPPMAVVELKANGWRINNSILKLTTRYEYDRRGRVTISKVPDKGAVYTVYDILNRPVLTQDALQRTKSPQEWSFVKYDLYGRTAISGVFKSNLGREELQRQADQTNQSIGNVFELHEEKTTDASWRHYTNHAFPTLFPTDEVETVSYYDDYDFNKDGGADAAYIPLDEAGFSGILPAYGYRIFGKPTGSYTRLDLDGEIKWLKTYVFYDEKGRAIQGLSDNHLGGTDVSTIRYDYSGKVLATHLKHETVQGNVSQIVQVKERYVYDHAGRPLEAYQTIQKGNGTPSLEERLAKIKYNELGQVLEKKLGSNSLQTESLQTLDFTYNIQGWLTKYNDLEKFETDKDLFAYTLNYFKPNTGADAAPTNIQSMKWKTASDNVERGYSYQYDPLGRLKNATYTGGNTGENYTENNLDYDANGNILTLDRFGLTSVGNYDKTDQLTYNYDGNRLLSVTDAITATGIVGDFEDGDNTGSNYDYEYDLNGNLIRDRNKGIASIKYNPMDMPLVILWENGNKIEYLYDRAGNKLRSRAYEGEAQSLVRETDYVGGFVYEKNELSHMSTAEGRYLFKIKDVPSGGRTQGYEYFLTDHMGNLRVSFREGDMLTYTAGMEIENTLTENREFDNVTSVRSNSGQGRSSVYSAEIDQSVPMGIWKTLKVSKGDKVDVKVFARYEGDNTQNSSSGLGIYATTQVPNLTGGPDSKAGNSAPLLMLGLSYAPNQNQNNNNDVPRAYLIGILYDTEGNPVETHRVEVTSAAKVEIYEDWEELSKSIIVSQAGQLQIFVANEGDIPVFFDDMEIKLSQHLISQENHYSPFGINLVGIEKAGTNRFLYNAMTEKNSDFELDWYETPFRSYDAQIGRFHQVDKLAAMYPGITPYHFAMNNPVMANDPTGLKISSDYIEDMNGGGGGAGRLLSSLLENGLDGFSDGSHKFSFGDDGFVGYEYNPPPWPSTGNSFPNSANAPSAGGGSGGTKTVWDVFITSDKRDKIMDLSLNLAKKTDYSYTDVTPNFPIQVDERKLMVIELPSSNGSLDWDDLYDVLERAEAEGVVFGNFFIDSHGFYEDPAFMIGGDEVNTGNMGETENLTHFFSGKNIFIMACHAGGGDKPKKSSEFIQNLSDMWDANVFANRSWSPAGAFNSPLFSDYNLQEAAEKPRAVEFHGQWLFAQKGAKMQILNHLQIFSNGIFNNGNNYRSK